METFASMSPGHHHPSNRKIRNVERVHNTIMNPLRRYYYSVAKNTKSCDQVETNVGVSPDDPGTGHPNSSKTAMNKAVTPRSLQVQTSNQRRQQYKESVKRMVLSYLEQANFYVAKDE